jgi:arylsulfatase A-like enzyme
LRGRVPTPVDSGGTGQTANLSRESCSDMLGSMVPRPPRPRVVLALLLLLALGDWNCVHQVSRPRNVIFVFVDTLRADHLGCYGYPRDTSPHLDELAAEGVVFENAIAQAPWTLPSFMSLFTSHYMVDTHDRHDKKKLPGSLPVLPEYFKAAGYATGGFVDIVYLHARYGFERGFDVHVEQNREGTAPLIDQALAWLQQEPERRHFLFLHTYDVHGPYRSPPPFNTQFVTRAALEEPPPEEAIPVSRPSHVFNRIPSYQYVEGHHNLEYYVAQYDGAIAYIDSLLGGFFDELKQLGLYDDALILVSSDHGESLNEHSYFLDHGILTDPVIKVPLIVRFPHRRHAGLRVSGQVQLIDVYPTCLEMLDLEPLVPIGGKSLLPVIQGKQQRTATRAYFSDGIMDQWGIRSADWKYVRKIPGSREIQVWETCPDSDLNDRSAVVEELFDLRSDPGERLNLIASEPDRAAAHAVKLGVFLSREEQLHTQLVIEYEDVVLDEETKRKLRALGYAP